MLILRSDRTTPIGQMINSYLSGRSDQEDHVIHLLFSANRWEAACVIGMYKSWIEILISIPVLLFEQTLMLASQLLLIAITTAAASTLPPNRTLA